MRSKKSGIGKYGIVKHLFFIVKTIIILPLFLKVFCNYIPDNGHAGRNMLY